MGDVRDLELILKGTVTKSREIGVSLYTYFSSKCADIKLAYCSSVMMRLKTIILAQSGHRFSAHRLKNSNYL